MSLTKKIKNFINFSITRNFTEFDSKKFLEGKPQSGNESGSYGNGPKVEVKEEPAPVKEEPKVEAPKEKELDAYEKAREEVLAPVSAPKIEPKDVNKEVLARQEAEINKLKDKISEAEADLNNKKELAELNKIDSDLIAEADKAEAEEESEESTQGNSVEVADASGEVQSESTQNEDKDSAGDVEPEPKPISTPGTGGEAAVIAEAEALKERDIQEAKTPDYDGSTVTDARGQSYKIRKGSNGYYIKGTNIRILDADGNPTKRYRTLGNALKSGMNVNDYVKSKGGWAKYNKDLKSGKV